MKIAIPCLLLCMGCVDTVGPFVREVSFRTDGSLYVTRCSVELHHNLVADTLSAGECHTTTVRP
jgi:hypothetical protein